MTRTTFRFYGDLNDFLPESYRQAAFSYEIQDHSSIKDAVEALGVPHPEIDLLLVNSESVDFSYLPNPGDWISVYPSFSSLDISSVSDVRVSLPEPKKFVLDVHLGKLARYLRLLGFDASYRRDADDELLARISSHEGRILLTQDRGLLKRSIVSYGYIVRSPYPKQQLQEVMDRYNLYRAVAPFRRCPKCNGQLAKVEKQDIYPRLPHFTRLTYEQFFECDDCQQLYWKGAHFRRIQQFVDAIIAAQ